MWDPQNISPQGPLYVAIADALARDFEGGLIESGEKLPTHRDLARTLGVNVVTVTRAYAEAARRGLVEGEVGRGTFVKTGTAAEEVFLPVRRGGDAGDAIDFHFNMPASNPSILATDELFRELLDDAARLPLTTGYYAPGLDDHRAAGAEWMSRVGLEVDPGQVLVCTGGQHALSVTLTTLMQPGDVLLTEELTYPGMKALAGLLHLRLAPVAVDAEGLCPDAFEEACRKTNAKVVYVTPTIQNPTSTVMPAERRERVAAIARRHGVTVLEDDTTGFLCADAPAPIAAHAPERVWFVSSLSKSLSGGLRMGYLRVPDAGWVDRAATHLAALSWMTPPLMAEIAARWIRNGTADEMVAWKREEALARRALFERALPEAETISDPVSSVVWLELPAPWRSEDFAAQALQRGLAVTPAENFVAGRAPTPHCVRLSLGSPPRREDVERGVGIVTELLRGAPAACRSMV